EAPLPPLNLVGDFGGGALYLVTGVLAALLERVRSGKGDIVDAAMVDGAAPFYGTYATLDGKFVAIGAIEPQFWSELLARLGIEADQIGGQHDRDAWPLMRETLAAVFR